MEVSLDGIPTTGLREEVSRPVATCQKSWVGYALRKRATQACLMSVYFRKKNRRTDRQTDRRHMPRVEVSLDGIPTTGLREEVSRPVATCKKTGLNTRLKSAQCLMSVYFRKKDRQTYRQTVGQRVAINPAWRSP